MKNKTHLNMPGFKLPHMGSEKQVGPYKSALHSRHDERALWSCGWSM